MAKEQTLPDYPRGITFEQVWAALMETDRIVKDVAKRQEKTDREMRETAKRQEETDREMREAAKRQEETDREMKETARRQEETDREMKETARRQEETDREMREAARRQEETDREMKEAARRKNEFDQEMKEAKERHEELDRIVKENAKLIGGLGNRYGEMIECLVKPNLAYKFNKLGFVFTKVYRDTSIKDDKNNIRAQIDLTLENGDKVMIVEVKSKPSIEDIKDHVERMEKLRRHADLHNDKRKYFGAVAGMVINDNERDFILKNGFYMIEPSGETFTITAPEGEPKEW